MPELPEVETVVRTLEHQLDRVMIVGCEVFWNNIIGYPDAAAFCRDIVGKTIQGYHRHGKYMRFDLGDMEWICHMRMEGKFYVQQPQEPYDKHVHVILQLSDGRQLRYHDTRCICMRSVRMFHPIRALKISDMMPLMNVLRQSGCTTRCIRKRPR